MVLKPMEFGVDGFLDLDIFGEAACFDGEDFLTIGVSSEW